MAIDGAAVQILRQRFKIGPGEFATRLGISESYLRDIESGKRLLKRRSDLIFTIAEELAVPVRMISRAD